MATVGQSIAVPENGWKRYVNNDGRFNYVGFSNYSQPLSYQGFIRGTDTINSTIKFKFKGTKFKLMCFTNYDKSKSNTITIDGVPYTFSGYSASAQSMLLVYENLNLTNSIHDITITAGGGLCFDCIDIDSTGYLVHPTLNQVSDINSMQIGDCIPCRYTAATSGAVGYFSELGTCIANEIPVTGTAIPDGLFYFIKTDKGTLVADRVIQTRISWDTLNGSNFIEGKIIALNSINYLFRSLSGGCAFADANGNMSSTNQNLGGWPTNNEWDTYIVNSDLNGKIVKGDDNIWHWNNGISTQVKETPMISIKANTYRVYRGTYTTTGSLNTFSFNFSGNLTSKGFRSVLEYLEPNSKATTLWY